MVTFNTGIRRQVIMHSAYQASPANLECYMIRLKNGNENLSDNKINKKY